MLRAPLVTERHLGLSGGAVALPTLLPRAQLRTDACRHPRTHGAIPRARRGEPAHIFTCLSDWWRRRTASNTACARVPSCRAVGCRSFDALSLSLPSYPHTFPRPLAISARSCSLSISLSVPSHPFPPLVICTIISSRSSTRRPSSTPSTSSSAGRASTSKTLMACVRRSSRNSLTPWPQTRRPCRGTSEVGWNQVGLN
jgi:hypothetical protein